MQRALFTEEEIWLAAERHWKYIGTAKLDSCGPFIDVIRCRWELRCFLQLTEILTYLGYIKDFWSLLMASDPDLMKRINLDTVDALQLLALGKSRINIKMACGLVLGG
ncbi:conserved hypothetical protein [Aspergillus lentulus]|nr:conserved hypothetical protein [Aspergillus lentulus]